MNRLTTVLLASAGVAALAVLPASAALATDITNPADNPAPITLTVDGQTYHDGLDTLPGYDDYACTSIPGVSYDFADNEIDYPDGQTAHWTEWDRIPGYQVWLKQQSSPAPKPSSSSSAAATTSSQSSNSGAASSTNTTTTAASATTTTTTKGAPSTTTKASTTKASTKKASAKPSSKSGASTSTKSSTTTATKDTPVPKPTTTDAAAAEKVDAPTTKKSKKPSTVATEAPAGAPVPTETAVAASVTTDPTASPANATAEGPNAKLASSVGGNVGTTGAGLAVLAALFIVGAGTLAVQRVRMLRRGATRRD